jgi:hypothetical protein
VSNDFPQVVFIEPLAENNIEHEQEEKTKAIDSVQRRMNNAGVTLSYGDKFKINNSKQMDS